METNKKLVAISYAQDKCKQVSIVKNVNDNEYAKLVNEQNKYDSDKELETKEIFKRLNCSETLIGKLFSKQVFVAKATYDRFVDRGYINENKDFDKAFYDYVFNGVALNLDNAPEEFKIIYAKVGE